MELQNWAIDKIKKEYREDVALLIALDGNSVNGDGHSECFDYFIPATEKGYRLSQTFLVCGIGYDLYPRSWERTEKTASMDDWATFCLGNARIVYSRSQEEEYRFLSVKRQLFDNLENRGFMYRKALSQLDVAMDIYRTMLFEDSYFKIKMAAGKITEFLTDAIYFLNGTFDRNIANREVDDERICSEAYDVPKEFNEYFRAILPADTKQELRNLSHLIISTTRRFMADRKPDLEENVRARDFKGLADWYQELCVTFNRMRYYCKSDMAKDAFIDACSLQNELMVVGKEFSINEMDLLGSYDPDNLDLRKYASGSTIYVPSEKKRESWGAKSGAREFYQQRNEDIRNKFFTLKLSIYDLADEYCLSPETVRKIVYR